MRTILFTVLFACIAHCSSVSYSVTDVTPGAGMEFRFVMFNVSLDVNPYVNGTAVSNLSLDPEVIGGRNSISAIVDQLLATTLTCPCSTTECGTFSVCNGTYCTFTANFGLNTATEGPPNILIPLPTIQDTLYVVFSVFAGRNASTLGLTTFSNTLLFGLAIRNYDYGVGSWRQYVPNSMNLSSCVFNILGNTSSNYYTDSGGTPIGPLSVGGNNAPLVLPCNYTALVTESTGIKDAISAISNATTKDTLQAATWLVATYLVRDSWLRCEQMARSMIIFEDVQQELNTEAACVFDPEDPQWATDPCCNR